MKIVRVAIEDAKTKGRYERYRAVAVQETATHLRVEEENYRRISGNTAPIIRRTLVPKPSSPRGLGDLVAAFTHATGLDRLARLYTWLTGRDCGCTQRRRWLNWVRW